MFLITCKKKKKKEKRKNALQIQQSCLSVNDNLRGKLVSSIRINNKFLIADLNLLCCELEFFLLKLLYVVIFCWHYIKAK